MGAGACLPGGQIARVSCYTPIMPRLTAREVVHASSAGRLAEAQARMALGDRGDAGYPEGVVTAG